MRKTNHSIIISLVALFIVISMHRLKGQDVAISKLEVQGHFETAILNQIVQKVSVFSDSIEVSICVIKDGIPNFYGVHRMNGELLMKENKNSIFEIGSITKLFTSTLMSNAIQEGKIQLMDPISDYLPYSLNRNREIPFKYLSNHTSGLPRLSPELMKMAIFNLDNPYAKYDRIKLEKYLTKKLKLKELPGEVYEYSNLGAGILGHTLTVIYNQSFEELLQIKVCNKYNLRSTSTKKERYSENFIKGRDAKGNTVQNWEFKVLVGAGGLYSNVIDLSKFALAQMDSSNDELSFMHKKTFSVSERMSIGLGWLIFHNEAENDWYFHNGGTGGYSSSLLLDLEKKDGVIILSNISAFDKKARNIDELTFEIMKIVQGIQKD